MVEYLTPFLFTEPDMEQEDSIGQSSFRLEAASSELGSP
jgi:hypothetical protein